MRVFRLLVAGALLVALTGCSLLGIERETGVRLGVVDGTRGNGIYQGDRMGQLADKLAPYGGNVTQVATKVARLDRNLIFVYAVTFDACSLSNPRLMSRGDNLDVSYDELDRVCEMPIPQTVFFALEWDDLPDQIYLGDDPDDPSRTRIVDREVQQPRRFALKALARSQQPAVEKTTFEVARTSAEIKKALAAKDIDPQRVKPKAGEHLLVVVRSPTCPTAPSLSMLDGRMSFYAADLEKRNRDQDDETCREDTVETAAFLVPRKNLADTFTLGPGEESGDEDITVTTTSR